MRFLYSLLLYLLVPMALMRLVWRGLRSLPEPSFPRDSLVPARRIPDYWCRWGERFGFVPRLTGPVIWVHAVSVGEVRACAPLVKALASNHPEHRMLITTMTPTGSNTVHEMFGPSVAHSYVPYDLPTAVRRFLNRTRPQLALIMETELWPNIFSQCRKRNIPLLLANVRMSEKSARGYRRFAKFAHATLANVSSVGAQTERDAERLRALGASHVEVTGNIKFEIDVPANLAAESSLLRKGFGDRPVWVAASTRAGEEEYVLEAFARLRERIPLLLLVLVPRHPERFNSVAKLCHQRGFCVERRSKRKDGVASDTAILLGDTMGEMLLFHAVADVSYIGGSLVPLGGQNLLEAAVVGTPMVFGPHMFNFSEISRMALEHGAGRQVHDSAALAATVGDFLSSPAARHVASEAGRHMVEKNRGALQRTLMLVRNALNK